MRIARTENFKKAWKQLTEEQKALSRKAIENLVVDTRYPGLRVKKVKVTEHIWEARVNRSIRMTFQIEGDTIILRNIGQHDETLGRP
jgi:mRNA-degrading endonuclease YafQ of YafQ-DinJ toxin-antitoxin module